MNEIHNGDSTNDNLLPCPFCGDKPIWYLKGYSDAINKKRTIVVRCPTCGTTQETAVLKLSTQMGCLMAEGKWNLREWKKEEKK